MSKLFWALTVGMIALAVHISYVLFAPALLFQQKLYQATEGRPDNSLSFSRPKSNLNCFLPPRFKMWLACANMIWGLGNWFFRQRCQKPIGPWISTRNQASRFML